jgi:hypothetical protein
MGGSFSRRVAGEIVSFLDDEFEERMFIEPSA